ncbi:SMI1/KNR4 family protein [Streptomyces halstedii]|uniref:SMI1/KNR4 family protein n=1 Tax=Streptomyces halstedii TaxID=1944 RepID=UPI0033603954
MTSLSKVLPTMARLLEQRAPATTACLQAPATREQIAETESALNLDFPEDFVEWLRFANGLVADPVNGLLLPPFFFPVELDRLLVLWNLKLAAREESTCSVDGLEAGSSSTEFSRYFAPIGDDATGDLLVIDLRPGNLHGCILAWGKTDGHFGAPVWLSVEEMWKDVTKALETGETMGVFSDADPHLTVNGCAARFTIGGALVWEF